MSISATTQHPLTTFSTSSTSGISAHVCIIQPRNFLFLIPTITGIALGLLFLPNFGLGLAVGVGELVFTVISMAILSKAGIFKYTEEKNSEYAKHIRKSLLSMSLFAPIAEEGVFRGFFQPLLTKSIQVLVPVAAAALFGTGLSVATAVSIVATSVLFGAIHYFNPHKNAHVQAVICTVSGLVLGILSAQFGIGASIAAHIANNSIMGFFIAFSPSDHNQDRVHGQKKFEVPNLPT